jgi:hypothetical protein
MYAYYTLCTIAIVYLIFAVLSLKYGCWYYLFIHPFALICGELVLHYRYVSDITSLITYVDRILASGIILASLMFGIGYISLNRKILERFTTFWFIRRTGEKNAIASQKFWLYLIFILLAFICYYICQYIKLGKFELMFFQLYSSKHVVETVNMEASFTMRLINFIISKIFIVLPFLSLVLLIETLRKHGKEYKIYTITATLLVLLMTMTGCFLTGARSYTIYFAVSTIILVSCILLQLNTHHGLRKISIPIIALILVYCFLFFSSVGLLRMHGINSFGMVFGKIFNSKEVLQKTIKDNFFIHDQKKFSDTITHLDISLEEKFWENEANMPPHLGTLDQVEWWKKHKERKIAELQYLKSLPPHGYRISMEIGWIVAYFGRHEEYMGITAGARTIMNDMLPPPLGKDRLWISPFKKLELLGRGNAEGYFGEGYVCYGIIGGYLYWGIAAFILGILTKITVFYLFSTSISPETTTLGLCLYCTIPTSFTSNYTLLHHFLYGCVLLWISMFVISQFYKKIMTSSSD